MYTLLSKCRMGGEIFPQPPLFFGCFEIFPPQKLNLVYLLYFVNKEKNTDLNVNLTLRY